jgi:hypothetical protein
MSSTNNKFRNALDNVRISKEKSLDKDTIQLNKLKNELELQQKIITKSHSKGDIALAKTQFAIAEQIKFKIDEIERTKALDQLAGIINENNSANSNSNSKLALSTQENVNNSINLDAFNLLVNKK